MLKTMTDYLNKEKKLIKRIFEEEQSNAKAQDI
jgi:hypothetical protein